MQENLQKIIIGLVILIMACTFGTISVLAGVFRDRVNARDNRFSDFKSLKESNEKIIITANNENVNIRIPSDICLEKKIDIDILNGVVIGNTDVITTNNII